MDVTHYRRPLPPDAVAFSSAEGRALFAEALAAGGLDGFFPLAEQFHTQSDPAFCGLGSLVVALNALAIDPGRLWKGPWRWFGEELLDCCVPLDEVRKRGLAIDELACLARCNGADVDVQRTDGVSVQDFRAALAASTHSDAVMIVSYDRSALGQTGAGHFSPIGGYHAARDLVLVLDVARFKYPPHWISVPRLFEAMRSVDATTGRPRGFLLLRARNGGLSRSFYLKCDGVDWRTWARQLAGDACAAGADASPGQLAALLVPVAKRIEIRSPLTPAHVETLSAVRTSVRSLPLHDELAAAMGVATDTDQALLVTLLLLACAELLLPSQRARIDAGAGRDAFVGPLGDELTSLRAQVAALRESADEAFVACATVGSLEQPV